MTRAGASPGDLIAVTARSAPRPPACASPAGGRVRGDLDRALLHAHVRPIARVGEGAVLARHGATAMMDISDGLAMDLGRLVRASGAGARLRLGDVPVADGAASWTPSAAGRTTS